MGTEWMLLVHGVKHSMRLNIMIFKLAVIGEKHGHHSRNGELL
jgi:hypothetical protein